MRRRSLPGEIGQLVALVELEAEILDGRRGLGLADQFDLGGGDFRGAEAQAGIRRNAAGDPEKDVDGRVLGIDREGELVPFLLMELERGSIGCGFVRQPGEFLGA